MNLESLLTESVVDELSLAKTDAYSTYLALVEDKVAQLEPEFFLSPAMIQDSWKVSIITKSVI